MTAVDCQAYPLGCDLDGMCALAFDYDDAVDVDLGRDVPALKSQLRSVLAQATLARIDTTVTGGVGTLSVRAANLFVAPKGTPSARADGVIFLAGIPLGSGTRQVDLDAQARFGLSSFLADFNTPFTLILSAHVVVKSGAAPKGVATINVDGRVEASF